MWFLAARHRDRTQLISAILASLVFLFQASLAAALNVTTDFDLPSVFTKYSDSDAISFFY